MKVTLKPNEKYEAKIEQDGKYKIKVSAKGRVAIDFGEAGNKVASNYGYIAVEKFCVAGEVIHVINESNKEQEVGVSITLLEKAPENEESGEEVR